MHDTFRSSIGTEENIGGALCHASRIPTAKLHGFHCILQVAQDGAVEPIPPESITHYALQMIASGAAHRDAEVG